MEVPAQAPLPPGALPHGKPARAGMKLDPGVVVLWRGDGETHVGLARPHIFGGLTARDQQVFASLEDGKGLDVAALSVAGKDAADALAAAGVLRSGTARAGGDRPQRDVPTVAIFGLGATGLSVATALARAGYALELSDPRPAVAESRDVFAVRYRESTCAGAAARTVQSAIPGATVRVGVSAPRFAVVTGVGSADAVDVLPLMRDDVPHLLIASDEAGVTVGPLVIPGRTACGRCLALSLTDVDPAWPILAAQCGTRRRGIVAPAVATLAGAMTCAMVDAWARSHTVAWAVNSRWRMDVGGPPAASPVWPHIDCGCGAAQYVSGPWNYSEGADATSSSSSMPYLSSLDAPMP